MWGFFLFNKVFINKNNNMKKVVRLTESELVRMVRKIVKENEEEWIDTASDMEGESDYGDMHVEEKAMNDVADITSSLSHSEKHLLKNYLKNVDPEDFKDMVRDEIEASEEMGAITEEDADDIGMSDEEFHIRKIIDKIIGKVGVGTTLGIIPAMMFVSGGMAVGLGLTALAAHLLRDAAWYKKEDSKGAMPGSGIKGGGIYDKAAAKARKEYY